MDILQYLIELLKIRKEIGIEGLGTLYKKKTPGRYDAETHSFLPPSHALAFSTEVTEHVNLGEYIQSKRSISEESATYFITGFVEEVNNALEKDGKYTLDNLGDFTLANDQLVFTPTQEINIGFDFFALPTVAASTPIVNEGEENNDEIVAEAENEQKSAAETIELTTPPPEEESTEETEKVVELEAVAEIETPVVTEDEQKLTAETVELPTQLPVVEPIAETEQVVEEELLADTETDVSKEEEPATDLSKQVDIAELQNEESVVKEPLTKDENLEETSSQTFEDNEATDEEVYEEIAEVDTSYATAGNAITEIEKPEEVVDDVTETWDFDDKDVISEQDLAEEKFKDQKAAGIVGNTTADAHQKKPGSKINVTTTTNDWDFDKTAAEGLDDEREVFYDPDARPSNGDTKTSMPWYQKIAIGIFILAAIIFAAYLYNPALFNGLNRNNHINPDQKIAVPVTNSTLKTQQDSLSFADSIMQSAEKAGLTVEPAKDTLKVTAKATPLNVTTYEIIGAALATNAEVNQYIATMKRNGFDAKIAVNMPGKIYKKISIASYTSRDSATKELKKLRVRLKNPELYIFEDKNK